MTKHDPNAKRLRINPDPIKVVPDAQRDVWTRLEGFRCDYTDARGRCTSRFTRSRWNKEGGFAETFCEKHWPEGESASLPRTEQ